MLQTEPRDFFIVSAEDVVSVAIGHGSVTRLAAGKARTEFKRRISLSSRGWRGAPRDLAVANCAVAKSRRVIWRRAPDISRKR
jgi:hypothetical protein